MMRLLDSISRILFPGASRVTPGVHPSNPGALASFVPPEIGGRPVVTEQTALNLSAVWAATRVVSGAVSVIPLKVYGKGVGGEADEVKSNEPAGALAKSPCPEMTASTFWETLSSHVLLYGNCYAEIERNGLDEPIALWPLPPDSTRPVREKNGNLAYEAYAGQYRAILPARDILHVPGLGFDGLRGYGVIQTARRSLGLATTAELAGEGFFANGMRPGGWVEYPGSFQELQKQNFEEGVKNKHGGATKFGKALLMWGGMKYHELSINPSDAQFLETRQFQVVEVARWFNIPPHMLRDLSRATFSNIEHQGQEFVTNTLMYWLNKFAQEWTRKLLPASGDLYAEHVPEALLRGDTISRYTAYGLGRQWGFLSPNDCRRRENLKPIPDGDVYHVPVNMAPLGSEPSTEPEPQDPDPMPPVPGPGAVESARLVALQMAQEINDSDCYELEKAMRDPDVLVVWADQHRQPGAWGWVSEIIPNRCRVLGAILGRDVSVAAVAELVGAVRAAEVRYYGPNDVFPCWQRGGWVEGLADTILEAAGAECAN
jgi:HK97 family phage portal protein